MIGELLPRRADNTYRGHKLALWIFGLLLLMKAAIGVNSIVNGRSVAVSADGIPLDAFTPAGANAFVSAFALLGLSHVMASLLGVIVLLRYRTLVPLVFAFLLLQHLSSRWILRVMPIARIGTPPAVGVNLVLLALIVVGLALSLWIRNERA